MKKLLQGVTAAVFGVAMATTSAHALSLSPGGESWTSNQTSNCDAACVSGVTGIAGLTEVYKQNVGDATDSGSFAGSYSTTFANTSTDPADFTITYGSGPSISCGTCVLVVKDGNQSPAQYFFNLSGGTALAWNGTETISGSAFWPANGAISHVSIYNVGGTSVPEPTSLLLLGAGVAGVSLFRRKAA